jgi:hypothetical protein
MDTDCPICMEQPTRESVRLCTGQGRHIMCIDCILKSTRRECPVCKHPFLSYVNLLCWENMDRFHRDALKHLPCTHMVRLGLGLRGFRVRVEWHAHDRSGKI